MWEKNKFDQSEGGSYRFGYGFRKPRRILFLRKPDKKASLRGYIFARMHACVPQVGFGRFIFISFNPVRNRYCEYCFAFAFAKEMKNVCSEELFDLNILNI